MTETLAFAFYAAVIAGSAYGCRVQAAGVRREWGRFWRAVRGD